MLEQHRRAAFDLGRRGGVVFERDQHRSIGGQLPDQLPSLFIRLGLVARIRKKRPAEEWEEDGQDQHGRHRFAQQGSQQHRSDGSAGRAHLRLDQQPPQRFGERELNGRRIDVPGHDSGPAGHRHDRFRRKHAAQTGQRSDVFHPLLVFGGHRHRLDRAHGFQPAGQFSLLEIIRKGGRHRRGSGFLLGGRRCGFLLHPLRQGIRPEQFIYIRSCNRRLRFGFRRGRRGVLLNIHQPIRDLPFSGGRDFRFGSGVECAERGGKRGIPGGLAKGEFGRSLGRKIPICSKGGRRAARRFREGCRTERLGRRRDLLRRGCAGPARRTDGARFLFFGGILRAEQLAGGRPARRLAGFGARGRRRLLEGRRDAAHPVAGTDRGFLRARTVGFRWIFQPVGNRSLGGRRRRGFGCARFLRRRGGSPRRSGGQRRRRGRRGRRKRRGEKGPVFGFDPAGVFGCFFTDFGKPIREFARRRRLRFRLRRGSRRKFILGPARSQSLEPNRLFARLILFGRGRRTIRGGLVAHFGEPFGRLSGAFRRGSGGGRRTDGLRRGRRFLSGAGADFRKPVFGRLSGFFWRRNGSRFARGF